MDSTPNTPANGGQILTDERIIELAGEHGEFRPSVWDTGIPQFHTGQPGVINFARAIEADLRASPAAPAIPTVDRNAVHWSATEICDAAVKAGLGVLECNSLIVTLKSAAPASVPQPDECSAVQYLANVVKDAVPMLRTGFPKTADLLEGAVRGLSADGAQPAAQSDEPTDREALIASLEDDAAKLSDANPDDEMAQTMREAAAMLEVDVAQPAAQVAVSSPCVKDGCTVRVDGVLHAHTHHGQMISTLGPIATPATVKTAEKRPLTRCAASRDGDWTHPECPQLRDNEPHATGRHCPIDTSSKDE